MLGIAAIIRAVIGQHAQEPYLLFVEEGHDVRAGAVVPAEITLEAVEWAKERVRMNFARPATGFIMAEPASFKELLQRHAEKWPRVTSHWEGIKHRSKITAHRERASIEGNPSNRDESGPRSELFGRESIAAAG